MTTACMIHGTAEARRRIGMQPEHDNVLVRLVICPLDRTRRGSWCRMCKSDGVERPYQEDELPEGEIAEGSGSTMCNKQRYSRRGGFARAGFLAALLAVGTACAEPPTPASEPSNDLQQPATNVIPLPDNPDEVLRALIAVLVRRDEIEAEVGQRLLAQDAQSRLELTGQSVEVNRDRLVALVPTESAKYVTSVGGRYVVGAILDRRPDGGTGLTLRPVLIATGGGGPLGGRPLPSNGTLERQLLNELNAELAKTR